MKHLILTLALLFSVTAQAADTQDYGFPPMSDRYLNRMLMSALRSMGCTVRSHLGVQGDERHMRDNPSSCHMVARAIDIGSLACENRRSNDENLRTLASYFTANPFILICYKNIGPVFGACLEGHGNHLHYGGRQALGCKNPFPF